MFSQATESRFDEIISLYQQIESPLSLFMISDRPSSLGLVESLARETASADRQLLKQLDGSDFGIQQGLKICAEALREQVSNAAKIFERISSSARPSFDDLRDLKHAVADLQIVGIKGRQLREFSIDLGRQSLEIARLNGDVIVGLSGLSDSTDIKTAANLEEIQRRASVILQLTRGSYADTVLPLAVQAQKLIGSLSLLESSDWLTLEAKKLVLADFSLFREVLAKV